MKLSQILSGLVVVGALGLFLSLLPQPEPAATGGGAAQQTVPAAQPQTAAAAQNSFVLGPVQLFDGEQLLPELQYIQVEHGRITALQNTPMTTDLPLIDGKGQTLIPGLIDSHTHIWGNALQQQLQFGVTTVLDMFTMPAVLQQFQPQRSGVDNTQMADLWSSGILATAPKGHGTEYGMAIPVLTEPAQAAAFVAARKAEGSDYIKIVYQSPAAVYQPMPSISFDIMQALIEAAHQQQLLAVVHIAEQVSALDAVKAGADGLVHSFFDSIIQPELLTLMRQQQVFVIPTLSILENFSQHQANQQWLLSDPGMQLDASQRISLEQGAKPGANGPVWYANLIKNSKLMHQAGIRLLAGTDSPNPGTAHGVSLAVELLLLQEAGLSKIEAVRAATSLPAQIFGLTDRGMIKPGLKADFVLINDLSDLKQLLKPQAIYKNGYLLAPTNTAEHRLQLKTGVLADFSSNDRPEQGLAVSASSDQMMHGASKAELSWQATGYQGAGALRLTGKIQAGFSYPWAGIAYLPGRSFEQGADLSTGQQLQFALRGTPGTYKLMIFTEGAMRPSEVSLQVTADWQLHTMEMRSWPNVDLTRISMLLWSATLEKGPQDFQLELDALRLLP